MIAKRERSGDLRFRDQGFVTGAHYESRCDIRAMQKQALSDGTAWRDEYRAGGNPDDIREESISHIDRGNAANVARSDIERSTIRAISWRIIPFLIVAYFFSYPDRVNLGFAALTMNAELKLSSLIAALLVLIGKHETRTEFADEAAGAK